ncbi:alpha/beta hydrolase-fold protein [Shimazuella sp. AN120528]|uniref:alpha/beta hydrolase n=1 Tax=Shimazuella soli TaxID=1892854 RepID=UPI001F0DC440|nr:alpha/beta hydrolase-fold protein [Shimazuella soli]MCH5583429.1 alpha/beta hydrolase-fold protein [Shimazuella soli]
MEQKYLKRTIKRESLQSKYLETEKKALVYLPPNFDTNHKYPALFLHDGDDYFSLGRIATQANKLIDEQKIEPLIMIAVPVEKKLRTREYSPIGDRQQAHIDFMTNELLPYIQERYPIDNEKLVVGGSSLGGTVSLYMALQDPALWNKVLSQSGAFLPQTSSLLSDKKLNWLSIYQSIGLEETSVPTHVGNVDLVKRNREVHAIFQAAGANVHYVEQEGDHTWGTWQKELPVALQFFFAK